MVRACSGHERCKRALQVWSRGCDRCKRQAELRSQEVAPTAACWASCCAPRRLPPAALGHRHGLDPRPPPLAPSAQRPIGTPAQRALAKRIGGRGTPSSNGGHPGEAEHGQRGGRSHAAALRSVGPGERRASAQIGRPAGPRRPPGAALARRRALGDPLGAAAATRRQDARCTARRRASPLCAPLPVVVQRQRRAAAAGALATSTPMIPRSSSCRRCARGGRARLQAAWCSAAHRATASCGCSRWLGASSALPAAGAACSSRRTRAAAQAAAHSARPPAHTCAHLLTPPPRAAAPFLLPCSKR